VLRPGGAGIESLTGAPTAFFYAKAVNHLVKCPSGYWATSHSAWHGGGYDPLVHVRGGACQTDNTFRFSGAFVAPSTGACTLWLACPGTGRCSLAIDGQWKGDDRGEWDHFTQVAHDRDSGTVETTLWLHAGERHEYSVVFASPWGNAKIVRLSWQPAGWAVPSVLVQPADGWARTNESAVVSVGNATHTSLSRPLQA